MKNISKLAVCIGLLSVGALKAGDPRVSICHFDGEDRGRIIEVAPASVDDHVAKHGDLVSGQYTDLGDGTCEAI